MKRFRLKHTLLIFVLMIPVLIAVGVSAVMGQNNSSNSNNANSSLIEQSGSQPPRRLQGNYPPITASPSAATSSPSLTKTTAAQNQSAQNQSAQNQAVQLPAYVRQENLSNASVSSQQIQTTQTNSLQANSQQMIQPSANLSPNAQNVQLVAHQAEENAPNMNQPAVLSFSSPKTSSAENNAASNSAAANSAAQNSASSASQNTTSLNTTSLRLLPTENQPASAQLRSPSAPLNNTQSHLANGVSQNHLSLNASEKTQVPEHVVQGVSQLQEETQNQNQNQNLQNQNSPDEPITPQFIPPNPPLLNQVNPPDIANVPHVPNPPQNHLPEQISEQPPEQIVPYRPITPQNNVPQNNTNTLNNNASNSAPLPNNLPNNHLPQNIPHQNIAPQTAAPNERYARNSVPGFEMRLDNNVIGHDETSNSAASIDAEGTGLPGPKEITGAQIPQLVIEKVMPQEIQINELTPIKIVIRNTGSVIAKNVIVADRLPKGARFSDAGQFGKRADNGDVLWDVGNIGINEEKTVEYRIIPASEGEIGSVVTATFSVEASASTRVTKPALNMEVKTLDKELLVGGELVLEILLSNPGTGTARSITIEEYVPDGLSHPKGRELRSMFGDLQPGESKRLKLTLKCDRAGEVTNYLVAKAENELMVESKMPLVILSPGLSLAIEGPKNRYLERQATYELKVSNPGSATARDVKLVAQLPQGLKFVSTDSRGAYDPASHTVHWALDQLPAQQSGTIELVTLPQVIGEHKIDFVGRDNNGLQASTSHEVSVDGIASLGFDVVNKIDPVELGREAIYEIHVQNRGSKASSNIALRIELSPDMRFVAADGATQYRVSESTITFDTLSQLAPKEEKVYTIKAQCLAVGDHRVIVRVQSDELERPVTKEENTKVYGDEN